MSVNSAPGAQRETKDVSQAEASRLARNSDALALELIDLLGVDGARRMCREQCWDGVANAIDRVAAQSPKAA